MTKLRLVAFVFFVMLSTLVCPLVMAAEPVKIEFMTPLFNEEVKTCMTKR
jgi:hypothetical protein